MYEKVSRKLGVRGSPFFYAWGWGRVCVCVFVCDVHHMCASGNVQGRENPNPLLASAPAAFFSLTGPARGSTTRRASWLRCRLQPRHQEVPAVCRFSNRLHTVCAAAAKRTEPRVTHLAAAIAENLLVAQPEGARWPLSPCHNIRKNVLPYCETVACQHRIGPPFEAHTLPGSARKENLLSLQKRLWCEMQGPKRHAQVTLLPCVCAASSEVHAGGRTAACCYEGAEHNSRQRWEKKNGFGTCRKSVPLRLSTEKKKV